MDLQASSARYSTATINRQAKGKGRSSIRRQTSFPLQRAHYVQGQWMKRQLTDRLAEAAGQRQSCFTVSLVAMRLIFLKPINVLLICAPLGVASSVRHWGDQWTFWLNFVAMIPLAAVLGDTTEALAACLKNDMLSGLLNATFGNAVEMIMTVMFLRSSQPDRFLVVKSTLLGSILSNMLLVLGMSFFLGGFVKWWKVRREEEAPESEAYEALDGQEDGKTAKDPDQTFGKTGVMVNATMLLVACLILGLVTIFFDLDGKIRPDAMIKISRGCAILMILNYAAYIFFQLVTHERVMRDEEDDGDDDEEPELEMPLNTCLLLMLAVTIVVSFSSELLTNSLEGALERANIGKQFTGIILLPIVGNACEHAAALTFAIKDKAGLSVGIAVGSSVQIALFVYPFAVMVGWCMGDDPRHDVGNMDLNFGELNVAVLLLSVLVVLSIVLDGKSNWLEGFMLCVAYIVIAILYWFVPDPQQLA